jgi:hypothetical protein
MTETFTADQVRAILRRRCEEGGGVTAWAIGHGMTRSHVYAVLDGAAIGPKVCASLGLKRKTVRTSIFVLDKAENAA